MAAKTKAVLYDNLSLIIEDYLGPAGDRFLSRQINFHLDKKPEQITKSDLDQLTEWIKVSLALLTEDKKIVDECIDRIGKLA